MSDVIVKYRAQMYCGDVRIYREEFVREADGYLVDSLGRKFAKVSKYDVYFDTWAEAHAELVRAAESYTDNVRGMKEPTV